ncbi:response regulator [Azospirillum halopraeferens]|uniref:response regulator n=1 Tax=Azospirillum halopraeferens TaxID=34010 RepID=UPI0004224CDD|nr:response regulator [Azospirillum halopraeferens]
MATVLVIDDDDLVRTVLLRALSHAGYTALAARDGAEGVALLQDTPTDVVITDIFMPHREGLATIMELRRLHPSVRIIAMSGGGAPEAPDLLPVAAALGARRTLRKPFTRAEVTEAVRAVLAEA